MYFRENRLLPRKPVSIVDIGLVCLTVAATLLKCATSYQIGLGRADITGPPVEIHFVSSVSRFTKRKTV